jgi:hypothetical protein
MPLTSAGHNPQTYIGGFMSQGNCNQQSGNGKQDYQEFFSWKSQAAGKTLDDFMKSDFHEAAGITLMIEGISFSLRGLADVNQDISLQRLAYTLEELSKKLGAKLQVLRLIYEHMDIDNSTFDNFHQNPMKLMKIVDAIHVAAQQKMLP